MGSLLGRVPFTLQIESADPDIASGVSCGCFVRGLLVRLPLGFAPAANVGNAGCDRSI